jgi:lipopolysaccharide export system permease protein
MARPAVRILSRYLLRQHLPPLAFALGGLTTFLLVQQIAKRLGDLVGKGLPWGVIVEVFVLSIPFIVAMTLPMAALVAVLYTFTRLGADNEITAMKAGGVSLARLVAPVLGGAAALSLVALLWNDQVLPRANHRLRTLLMDITRKKPSFSLKEEVINEVLPGQFFLRAARIDPVTNRLKDVTIYDLGDAPERRRIIVADSGRMANTPGGTDLYLTLFLGEIREVKRTDPDQFNRTFFGVNRIKVAGVGNALTLTKNDPYQSDREMSLCELAQQVRVARREEAKVHAQARASIAADLRRLAGLPIPSPLQDAAAPPPGPVCRVWGGLIGWLAPKEAEAAVLPPLPPSQQGPPPQVLVTPGAGVGEDIRARGDRQRAATYAVEVHKKLAIAAACFAFALLGIPMALRFPRGGAGLVIGTSVIVFAIYYIGLIGGEDLGDRLIVSPFVAMWIPNVLFTVLGLAGLWAVRRAQAA